MPRSYDDELHALRHQVESLTLLREIAVAANEATVYTDAISVALDRICAHIE